MLALQFKSGASSYYIDWDGNFDGLFDVYTDLGSTSIAWPVSMSNFNMRIHGDSTVLRVRMWNVGDAEPSTWNVEQAGSESTPFDEFFYTLGVNITTALNGLFSISGLAIDGVCAPIPVSGGSGVSSNAWVCEQFDVVTTTLTLAHSFLLNSPQVWFNGLLQIQSSYTQDAAAGTITFGFTPGPSDNARVCYWATT